MRAVIWYNSARSIRGEHKYPEMKTIAKICLALASALIILAAAYALSSRLSVTPEISVTAAADMPEKFELVKSEIAAGDYAGVSAPGDINEYSFVTVKTNLKSYSPFRAEWITLSLRQEGALQVESNAWVRDMPAFGALEGDDAPYVTLLVRSSSFEGTAQLEYYVFGRYHSREIGVSGAN